MEYSEIVKFHGHSCPGLAMGYRMSLAAMETLESFRSEDEEVVAIVENDACGVDALQCLTGCTFGKGNLIFRDYGKQVYTIFSRRTGRGVRVLFHGKGAPAGLREDKKAFVEFILNVSEKEIISFSEVTIEAPEQARIRNSVICAGCSEPVMDTRLKEINGRRLCIPCAEGVHSVK
jgi:formylmethanofuran dehydrogenase subunit E